MKHLIYFSKHKNKNTPQAEAHHAVLHTVDAFTMVNHEHMLLS